MKLLTAITLVALILLAGAPRAGAQTSPLPQPEVLPPPRHHARNRITIRPERLLYRRCTDWYELQRRPSGTVLYPQMRCWWVRG